MFPMVDEKMNHDDSDGNYNLYRQGKLLNCVRANQKFCEMLLAQKEIDKYQLKDK